jgi:cysteine synthase
VDEPTVVEIVDSRIARNGARMFTTLEGENPSGSIKDRMVHGELSALVDAGELKEGDRVSEVSAGSTARSLAHHSRRLGLVCDLFVPDTVPEEAIAELEQLGANVYSGNREEGYALYMKYCEEHPNHPLNQLGDESLARHYTTIGATVSELAGPIDTIIGAVGTGHSLLGAAGGIDPAPFVVTAEPAEPNAVLGIRNIELERFGPQDGCKPELFDLRLVLDAGERRDFGAVATDKGEMAIGESFSLVLSAAERLVAERDVERLLLVGAENRL